MSEEAKGSLLEALCAFQGEAPGISKDRTVTVTTKTGGQYQYSYAPLDTIVEKVGKLLAKHGLVWSALPGNDPQTGDPILKYTLAHAATGESMSGEMLLVVQNRQDVQALGSAITYARRYALTAVLNLVADTDDDGQAAGGGTAAKPAAKPAPKSSTLGASEPQRKKIQVLLKEKDVSRTVLAGMLHGHQIELKQGWMDELSKGAGGSASMLIDALEKLATPPPQEVMS